MATVRRHTGDPCQLLPTAQRHLRAPIFSRGELRPTEVVDLDPDYRASAHARAQTDSLLLYQRAHSAHLDQAAADTDLVFGPGSSDAWGGWCHKTVTINEHRPASSPLCQVG